MTRSTPVLADVYDLTRHPLAPVVLAVASVGLLTVGAWLWRGSDGQGDEGWWPRG